MYWLLSNAVIKPWPEATYVTLFGFQKEKGPLGLGVGGNDG